MNESFLHYIWQHRLFQAKELVADDGCRVEIIKAGTLNTSAGPDFFNAQIRIDGTLWVGNVEIHIHSSDWQRHNHQTDPSYDSCILHVVYKYDSTTLRMNGTSIPTIEIGGRFPPYLWDNYLALIGTHGWIPCEDRIKEIDEFTWKKTIEELISERMEQRCRQILIALKGNRDDWQETFNQYLARNFGFQLNAMPFEMMARSLPVRILQKERGSLTSLEALMFGQAGMLERDFIEDYPKTLQSQYHYLKKKYGLKNIPLSAWKFLRLRPVNFPTLRIAQLAALNYKSPLLFSEIISAKSINELIDYFNVTASDYWITHYQFDSPTPSKTKKLGRQSILNILINTCMPFMYAWGKYSGNQEAVDRAVKLLEDIQPEENHLIDKWRETGVKVENAVDSQALLQLKIIHCSEKKCLTCRIGNRLINVLP
jgi:hypothetical protein